MRAWLGVAVLLLQALLTAGHFHPEDFAAKRALASATADGSGRMTPFPGQPALPAHDDCALCFNLQLLAGSAAPELSQLPLPSEHTLQPSRPLAELRLAQWHFFLFRTRAPPQA